MSSAVATLAAGRTTSVSTPNVLRRSGAVIWMALSRGALRRFSVSLMSSSLPKLGLSIACLVGAYVGETLVAVLAQIMPGVRHVRTPLVAGSLWLLVVWLWLGRDWPDRSSATGLWADLYQLVEAVGQPVALGGLAFTAYLVGARVQWLLHRLQDTLRAIGRRRTKGWLRRILVPQGLAPEVEAALTRAATMVDNDASADGHLRERFRVALDLAVAEAKLRWPAEAPDLFQEYDRRESERDFSNGIAFPLGVLSLVLQFTVTGWTVLAIALLGLALLSKQAGYHQHRELERFVVEAVLVQRVTSPQLTEVFGEWTAARHERLPRVRRQPTDAAPTAAE